MNKKRTSEKKGISLIVLVITIIVIIILAVAVILSIANNNPIENAKEARFKNDVKAMQEELELLKESNYAKNNGVNYNNTDGKKITIGQLQSASKYKGDFLVKDGELKYIADNLTGEEINLVRGLGLSEEKILKLGKEIPYQGEPFYIIGGDEVGTEITDDTQSVLLLAKYNLKKENDEITLKQDTSGGLNGYRFSNTGYWSSETNYPLDLNNYSIPDGPFAKKIPIPKAKAYGESLGVTGRLMTYEELEALQTDYSEILYGTNTEKGYLIYWLGSASDKEKVWCVYGYNGGKLYNINFGRSDFGVRPVIEVPKSLIQ